MQTIARLEQMDEDLVARVRRGEDLAFASIYRRYNDQIRRFVALRVADRGAADDVVQDVFIAALRGIRSSDGQLLLKAWLYEIARNACIDQHRRTVRRGEIVSLSDEQVLTKHAWAGQPDQVVEVRERFAELRFALDELPDGLRELVAQRELGDLSYVELAERQATTVGAVESALHRARRRLALRLANGAAQPARAA